MHKVQHRAQIQERGSKFRLQLAFVHLIKFIYESLAKLIKMVAVSASGSQVPGQQSRCAIDAGAQASVAKHYAPACLCGMC